MVLANLFLALEDTILFNVKTETTTKRLWKKQKSFNEEKSLVNKILFIWQIYKLKVKDGPLV